MNPTHNRLLALALACLFMPGTPPLRADEEADRAALRQIKATYEDAVNNDSLPKFAPFLGEGATGVMVTDEEVKNFAELEAYWRRIKELIGKGGSYHVTVNTDRTDLFGDIAVSRGTTDDTVHANNGREYKFHSHWTAVCRKQSGEWKVVRMHASMDPVSNAFVRTWLWIAKCTFGAGGLVVGLVVGIAGTLFLGRRGDKARG